MNSSLKPLYCAVLLALTSASAMADVVQFKWTTTVAHVQGGFPASVGESVTTILSLDNGGTSLKSQTWDDSSFVSFRVVGASGWTFEDKHGGSAYPFFSTDSNGEIATVAQWFGSGNATTSWGGPSSGFFFINGYNNYLSYEDGHLYVNNVRDNQNPLSWTVAFADQPSSDVPEPTSLALLGIGALALIRRTRK